MRYVVIEPAPEDDLIREVAQDEAIDLLVGKDVDRINAKGLVNYLPCGVRLSIGGMSIARIG